MHGTGSFSRTQPSLDRSTEMTPKEVALKHTAEWKCEERRGGQGSLSALTASQQPSLLILNRDGWDAGTALGLHTIGTALSSNKCWTELPPRSLFPTKLDVVRFGLGPVSSALFPIFLIEWATSTVVCSPRSLLLPPPPQPH